MDEICIASPTRSAKWSAHAVRQMLWLALALALPAGAQNGPPLPLPGGAQNGPSGMQQPTLRQHLPMSPAPLNDADPIQEERWLRGLNIERQKMMVSDANKLLKLASELNAEVSSSNQDSLTPAQLRNVAEIEKLARSVKEKMSTSAQGTPVFVGAPLQQHW